MLEAFGCEVVPLYTDPAGDFAHDSEPLPENIADICRLVRRAKADIGFVQDADADRLAVVNERGEPLGEELTMALAVRHVLAKRRGSIVCNLSSSRIIDDLAAERGCRVFRTRIGEINVVEKLLAARPRAVLGGEGNGGVIDPTIHPCRDSFAAMALILEHLAETGRKVSALQAALPRYVMIKDRLAGSAEQANRLIGRLRKHYEAKGRIDLTDGLKVDFPDHWIHVRPSNTEPIIRVLAEARTRAKAEAALAALKGAIAAWLEKA